MLIVNFECNPVLKACTLNWILLLRHSMLWWLQSKNILCEGKKVKRKKKKAPSKDFLGGPVAKTLCSRCRGPRFNPWSEDWILQATLKILRATTKTWKWKWKSPVVSSSLWPHGLYSPWNSPARILEWAVFPFCRGSSQPRDQPKSPRWILYQLSHKGSPTKTWQAK